MRMLIGKVGKQPDKERCCNPTDLNPAVDLAQLSYAESPPLLSSASLVRPWKLAT